MSQESVFSALRTGYNFWLRRTRRPDGQRFEQTENVCLVQFASDADMDMIVDALNRVAEPVTKTGRKKSG